MSVNPKLDALDESIRLHHELKNPLTVILTQTHLLQRILQQQAGPSEQEQANLQANLLSIEQQVQVLVERIDAIRSATYFDER